MTSDKKIITCYSCLQGSTDPDKCTNCGATIEAIDIDDERMMFIPPIQGTYLIPLRLVPIATTLSAVDVMRTKYFNDVCAEVIPANVIVRSNSMAYEKFLELLANDTDLTIEVLKESIIFLENS